MGYACPVCGVEQADAVHLANHLAVTASVGRQDHLEWLEAYAPDWGERGPQELAGVVREHAPEIDTPEFETGRAGSPTFEEELARRTSGMGRGELTSETQRALEEARELTRRMYENGEDASDPAEGASESSTDDGDGDENADGDANENA